MFTKKNSYLILFLLTGSSNYATADVDPFYLKHPFLCLSPQFGFDIGFTNITFTENQGYKMFAKQQFPISGYFNVSFNDKWGLEIGYTMPKRKLNGVHLSAGDPLPGQTQQTIPMGQFADYEAFVEFRQPYVGLKYDLHFDNRRPYLFGIIGVSLISVRAQWEQTNGTPGAFTPQTILESRRVFDFKKMVPFVKVGVYMPFPWNEHLFIRLATTWFNSSTLKNSVAGYAEPIASIRAKNMLHYSMGLAYSI